MIFNAAEFYKQLDESYAKHDNAATEAFLQEALKDVEFSMVLSHECACCSNGTCGDEEEVPDAQTVAWLNERSEGMICILNEMGGFYRGMHRWDECLDAFSRSKAEMEALNLTETDNYAIVLVNVAGAYRLLGRLDEALDCYGKAEEIFAKNGTADAYTLSSLYNNTGLVYQDKGDLDKAAAFYTNGLETTKKGADSEAEVATAYANLAALYVAAGDFAKAEENINESLAIFKDLEGGMNAHYAGALNTKAILAFRAGKLEESVESFKAAIEKTRVIFGENGDYVTACRNCAAVLTKLGKDEEAKTYLALADKAGK